MNRQRRWILVILVMLLAAGLRLWKLGRVPPGLSHDEVINGLVARGILRGQHAITFAEAQAGEASTVNTGGHEPFYHYAQAATVGLFGENWVGLRWPSFAFGLLTIATVYSLTSRMFNAATALLSAAWLGVSFWPLFYSRVGLRAIALPFTAALFAYFFCRTIGLGADRSTDGPTSFLLAGTFLGLSLYTYMAARILPFIVAAFLAYLFIVAGRSRPFPWSRILRLFFIAALIAAPLLLWLTAHPNAEERIFEVREPLDRLLAGDPSLVWRNLIANLGFFTFVGDPWFHQGLPGRPVFVDPISAAAFWVGVLIALWRWREPRYGFLIIWLVGALVPSVMSSHAPPDLTSDAPSSIRDILGLVVAFAFPAIAVIEAGHWIKRRGRCRSVLSRLPILVSVVALLLFPCLYRTVSDYFSRWAGREDVRYLYQADLTAIGHQLDRLNPRVSVTVAGLSVDVMDRPTLAFTAQTDVRDIRLCDARQTLVIPDGHPSIVLVPKIMPFDEQGDLQQRLTAWSEIETNDQFVSYSLSGRETLDEQLRHLETSVTLPDGGPAPLPVSFGGRLAFAGYEWLQRPSTPGEDMAFLTYWRVQSSPAARIKVFTHLLDEHGHLISQYDGLGSPPEGWAAGDLIVQKHTLSLPDELPPGGYTLQMGLYYDTAKKERLPVLTADRLLLYSLEVRE